MKTIALLVFLFCAACGASTPCRPEARPLLFMTAEQTLIHVQDIGEARLACAMSPDERFFIYEVRPHAHRLVMACVGGQIIATDRSRHPACFPHCYRKRTTMKPTKIFCFGLCACINGCAHCSGTGFDIDPVPPVERADEALAQFFWPAPAELPEDPGSGVYLMDGKRIRHIAAA